MNTFHKTAAVLIGFALLTLPASPGSAVLGANGVSTAVTRESTDTTVPSVQIDFDGIQQRILTVSGVPTRVYAQLKAGVAGSVFFLQAPTDPDTRGNTLHRFRLSDRKAVT